MTTNITVRVQANGGKFLADDIGGAFVTIRDALSGDLLAKGLTQGDSGTLPTTYSPTASQRAIITPGATPTIYWLTPDATTSKFTAEIEIEIPTLLEFTAYGPMAGLSSAYQVTTRQWVDPKRGLSAGPGFVIELPGLLVQPIDPPTHTSFMIQKSDTLDVVLKANVAMMCGCPITPSKPWHPDDFAVTAIVASPGSCSGPTIVPLTFNKLGIPSIFEGVYPLKQTGTYEVIFTAFQLSTGNTGSALVTFTASTPSSEA